MKSIGNYAFYGCKGIRLLNFNDNLESIGSYAFAGCNGLVSMVLNDNLKTLSNYAFANCINLTAARVPKSVTSFGKDCFSGCSKLTVYCYSGSTVHIVLENTNYIIFLLDLHEHKYETTIETSVTCTKEGSQILACTLCGYNYIELLEPLGHNYGDWVRTLEPKCEIEGEEERYCSRCDSVDSQSVGSLGHNYSKEWAVDKDATCDIPGSKSHHCSRCDSKNDVTAIEPTGHNYISVVTPATCTNSGYTVHTCSVCGDKYTDSVVAANGHTNTVWTEFKSSTCTRSGLLISVCDECGTESTKSVDALGHNFSDWYVTKNATVLAEGVKERKCSRCDEIETESIERITVDIDENSEYGLVYFTVVDAETLEPIENASIFVTTEKDGENTFKTDKDGKVGIVLPVGKQSISVFGGEYNVRNLKYTVVAGVQEAPDIGLSTDKIVDAEVTVKEMTYEEIINAGIDVSAEDNKQYYKWSLTTIFTPTLEYEFTYYTDSEGGYYVPHVENGSSGETTTTLKKSQSAPTYTVVNSEGYLDYNNIFSTNTGIRPVMNVEGEFEKITVENYEELDIIEFGSYPQTEVTSSIIKSALNNRVDEWLAYAVYTGEDKLYTAELAELAYYADVEYAGERYRALKFIEYRPYNTYIEPEIYNSYQDENGYYIETVYWFKYEPIKWVVLSESENSYFVVSLNCVDSQSFNYNANTGWKNSDLRVWLAEEFYETAFNETEKLSIKTTLVNNARNFEDYTEDKIYILSEDDIESVEYGFRYFESEDSLGSIINFKLRCSEGTDYSRALGVYDVVWQENEFEAYWIRTLASKSSSGSGGGSYSGGGGGLSGGGGGGATPFTVYPIGETEQEYFYLVIYGEVCWLKEMFDVEMLIINKSQTDTVENCTATLQLPEGLSLATMVGEQQTLEQYIDCINPGSTESVHWYVRGDEQGYYNITATLDGIFMPYEEEFSYSYMASDAMKVYAGSAMHMTFTVPDAVYEGFDGVVTVELENVSDKTLYNVSSKITDVFQYDSYYLDGDPEGLYYHATAGEYEAWEIGYCQQFEPGDKIILQMSTNILFHSRNIDKMLEQWTSNLDSLKEVKAMLNIVDTLSDVTDLFGGVVGLATESIGDIIEGAVAAGDIIYEAGTELIDAIEELTESVMNGTAYAKAKKVTKLMGSTVWSTLQSLAKGELKLSSAEVIRGITNTIKSATAAIDKSRDRDDPVETIKNIISLWPVRFNLIAAFVETREGSTTTIPYTIKTEHIESPYKGIFNIGKFMYNSVIALFGEIDVNFIFRMFGASDDPTGYHNAMNNLNAMIDQVENLNIRTGVKDTRVKAWVVKNDSKSGKATKAQPMSTYNVRNSGALYLDDAFALTVADNETVEVVDGVVEFTGNATLQVMPLSDVGGTLYIDMGDGEVVEYTINVVETHECASESWVTLLSPTSETKGYAALYCDVCEEFIGFKEVEYCNNHSFTEWTVDIPASCGSTGMDSRSCTICGYEETRLSDSNEHSGKLINEVKPTCTEPGYSGDLVCDGCGELMSEGEIVGASGHDYKSDITLPNCNDGGYTLNICSACGDSYTSDLTPKLGHSGGVADCKDKAVCEACGESYGEVNSNNHKTVVIDKAIDASCTSTGLTEGSHCDACGNVVVAQSIVNKSAHTEEILPAINATCSSTGLTEGKKCSVCGEILIAQTETSKLIHNYSSTVVNPSCTTKGYTSHRCTLCGYTYTSDEKPAFGHTMSGFIVVTKPGCTNAGAEKSTCSVCGYSESRSISATGHNYVNGVCKNCGDSKIDDCSCNCHKSGISKIIFKIILIFQKIFKKNKVCTCGIYHY